MNRRCKNWTFTAYPNSLLQVGSTPIHVVRDYVSMLYKDDDIAYVIAGYEICPKTGKAHLQGFMQLKSQKRFSAVKSIFTTEHIEASIGSVSQNQGYCKKDGIWVELGEAITQGQRMDIESACETLQECIKDGTTRQWKLNNMPLYVKYYKAFNLMINEFSTPRNPDADVQVYVYTGDTGTGKTRAVFDLEKDKLYNVPLGDKLQWFDGYNGQEAVLIDDFSCSDVKITWLLKLLDRYPMQVPVKGGFTWWKPKRIYITSNVKFDEWYQGARYQHREALKRRITEIKEFQTNKEKKRKLESRGLLADLYEGVYLG